MKAWKVRKLAEDVIWDLRNRGLLPVAALLVVAMVVVPVMITRSGSKPTAAPVASIPPVSAPENQAAVVAYSPGLRKYRKRLDALQAKDPFKQHFRTASAAASLSSQVTGSGGSSASLSGTTVSSGGSTSQEVTTDDSSGHSAPPRTRVETKYVSYRLDVSVGQIGALRRHNNVLSLSFLPSDSTPMLVYLGIGAGGTKALFLVSSDVDDVSGQGACTGSDGCEVLVLKEGQSEDLHYAPDGKLYRLKVVDLKRIVSSTPPA